MTPPVSPSTCSKRNESASRSCIWFAGPEQLLLEESSAYSSETVSWARPIVEPTASSAHGLTVRAFVPATAVSQSRNEASATSEGARTIAFTGTVVSATLFPIAAAKSSPLTSTTRQLDVSGDESSSTRPVLIFAQPLGPYPKAGLGQPVRASAVTYRLVVCYVKR